MQQGPILDRERPYFLILLGAIGLLGCVALIAGTIIAPFFVPDYHWISDTISDLAAGDSEIIMDVALYGFAAGLIATALAAAHAHLGGSLWTAGVVSLTTLSTLVIIVGARNEYGDSDSDGVVLHVYFVYGLGGFFLAAPLCMARGMRREHRWATLTLIGLGLAWGVLAPVFFFLPTSIDGLYERLLGLVACGIVATLSIVFLLRGRAAARRF